MHGNPMLLKQSVAPFSTSEFPLTSNGAESPRKGRQEVLAARAAPRSHLWTRNIKHFLKSCTVKKGRK